MSISSDENDKFDSLFVDEKAVNRELLGTILSEYLTIGKDNGDLFFKPPYHELKSGGKIAVTLAAQIAKEEQDMAESSWLSPAEVSTTSGLKGGTVRPRLQKLLKEGIVETHDGNYRIARPNLQRVKQFVSQERSS